jgi:cytochrome c-type biogenesis protein CcmH
MILFWVLAALLVLAALIFLLPPLLARGLGKDTLAREELNATIFKDQLAELERDLAAGLLTREQHDTARHDLERNFARDSGTSTEAAAGATDRIVGRATAVVIAVVVPVLAVGLYSLLGTGARGLNPQQATAEHEQLMQEQGDKETLQDAVQRLQERVAAEPDNVEDWVMLARSHYFLEQYTQASEAFARASTLLQDKDPDILADYADAIAMANERNMLGKPFDLVRKALSINPDHEKSLWLAGVAAFQAQDLQSTLEYWERLLQAFPPGSQEYQQMQSNVNEIRQGLGLPVTAAPVPAPKAAAGPRISGVVSLGENLAARAAPEDTVFIFARAVEGPRMPLAILRVQVKDLPMNFTLDDSLAMSPQLTLSSVEQVVVGARVSKSGQATASSGDLEGSSGPIAVRATGSIDLVIDRVVP